MKVPKRIQPLVDIGLVDEVICQLMSGKEATVYIVRCGDETRCAKVYKDSAQRSFKKAVQYQEGRKDRNSRRARAMGKGTRFGRQQQEERWQSAEVNALYKVADAGVRVPTAYGCIDGVLLMELVTDDTGDAAPRLNDVTMSPEQALEDHATMMNYVVRMLCAGLVHGDLSEFNVLVDAYGPVIIDMPQAVDAAANNNAQAMFTRDVDNMTTYYGQYAPELLSTRYAQEIWALFEQGELDPEVTLTGHFDDPDDAADVGSVLLEIKAALQEEEDRRERMSESEPY
ncbi:PA4780 family RIO1-like protein kinase [Porticoccus litoralis]|uniref:non-specific serine/threonine protein kinase n=1 Tax=Porticoccus litoralis TaxID=434086 RepID=A0AAW8B2B9_9GAMM|nr:PA4780 family RIO1-like protein kinase [Porticoccus litoralis]MDP1519909.1 PA4780 family RIO1-like protein kinase [Porticoccus litoralis]